jgi:adenine specific DNA methylase Mod
MLQLDTTGVSYYTNPETALNKINNGLTNPKKGAAIRSILTVKALSDREDLKQIKRFGTLPSDQTFKIVFK